MRHEIPYSFFMSAFVCLFWPREWLRKKWTWVWLCTRVQTFKAMCWS